MEDVVWGLQTAEALWKRGERIDAIVWLRRAAQAAGDASHDDRALELARLAAELTDWLTKHGGRVSSPDDETAQTFIPPAGESSGLPIDVVLEETSSGSLPSFPLEGESQRPEPPKPEPASQPTQKVADPSFELAGPAPEAVEETEAHPRTTTSVPPAERVHAGMYDPWAEAPRAPVVVPPAVALPSFASEEDEEVITSVRPQQLAERGVGVASERGIPTAPVASAVAATPELAPVAEVSTVSPVVPRPQVPTPALGSGSGGAPNIPRPPPLPPKLRPPREAEPAPAGEPAPAAETVEPAPAAETVEAVLATPTAVPAAVPTVSPDNTAKVAAALGSELDDLRSELAAEAEEDAEGEAPTLTPPSVPTAEASAVTPPETEQTLSASPSSAPPRPAAPPAASEAFAQAPLDLDSVEAFADLPDDARTAFAAAARIDRLAEGEEVSHFALAYVLSGAFDVAATMVDAPALRLETGAVLRARGTTNEGVPMRLISATAGGVVATWSTADVDEAFRTIPWVEDDLRAAADRAMTLVGITIGPLGERLDVSIREEIVGKLTMRPLSPGEVVVQAGDPVPGLFLVGVGELELVKGDDVAGSVSSGDFLFATEVLGAGPAPATARAGSGGALILYGDLRVAQELLVTCPPLLEVFAGM